MKEDIARIERELNAIARAHSALIVALGKLGDRVTAIEELTKIRTRMLKAVTITGTRTRKR